MKVVVYIMIGSFNPNGPEAPYMAEWEQIPGGRAGLGRPDMVGFAVSLTRNNGGHDWLIYMIDRMIRDHDIDGIYLDGAQWSPNASLINGFGYITEDGKVRPTNTILETRAMFKRIYALFLAHGKQPIIDHHCTWQLSGPVDAFATGHLTMEYTAFHSNENTTFPESQFRIENTGVQWGIPVEAICYNNKLKQRYIANTLVYGSTIRAITSTSWSFYVGRGMMPIWKAFKEFDVANAEWIPYWKTGEFVQSEHPSHKLSLYRHPEDGLLLLLANISPEPGSARISFDLEALGLGDGRAILRVVNKETHPFDLKDNCLTTPLAGDDFVMFRMTKE